MNVKKCQIGKSKASLTERVVSNYVQSAMLTPSWGTGDDSSLHGLGLFVAVYKRARDCPLLREEGNSPGLSNCPTCSSDSHKMPFVPHCCRVCL
jgi:hypothetical protein